jgi:hypothetical protein
MCHTVLCDQGAEWLRAYPVAVGVVAVFTALLMIREVRRGRVLPVVMVLLIWAIAVPAILFLG